MYKNIKIETELKKKSGIYKIVINNKFYIGSACNLYQRIHHHKSELLKNKHANTHLQRSFNKHKYFTFEILAECPKEYLLKLEQWFMDSLKPHINTINAGREAAKNRIYTDETRRLMSENMKRIRAESKNYNYKGERNNQSKLKDHQVLEIREKLRDGIKGVQLALEYNVSVSCISLIKRNKSYTHV